MQAKQWLEKLKKTMSVPKVGKRAPSMRSAASSQPNIDGADSQGGDDHEQSRPLLSDMKMMVMEGECLLSSNEGFAVAVGGGEGEGSATNTAGYRGTVSSRELSKAQSVVEVAEEVRLTTRSQQHSC